MVTVLATRSSRGWCLLRSYCWDEFSLSRNGSCSSTVKTEGALLVLIGAGFLFSVFQILLLFFYEQQRTVRRHSLTACAMKLGLSSLSFFEFFSFLFCFQKRTEIVAKLNFKSGYWSSEFL